jgi:hypothetical protein
MRGILVPEGTMRRFLPVVVGSIFAFVLLAVPGFAQRGGGGHGGGGGGARGGGGSAGGRGFSGGGFRGGGGAFRGGGGSRGGFRGVGGFRGRYGFRGLYGYGWGYPYYGYPGFFGDYGDYCDGFYSDCYGNGYGSGYSGYGPDYGGYPGYGSPSYSSPSPQVLIISNQGPPPGVVGPVPPSPSVWNAGPNAQASQKYQDPLYLLAMNDGTIRAVLAYWVDGATVHYVTMDHVQKQTPLASLDRSLSVRLNSERHVTFSLPG